jgi:hypothetical protein
MGWVFAAIESVDFTRSQLKAELIYGIRKPVLQSASSPTRQSRPANPVIPGSPMPVGLPANPVIPAQAGISQRAVMERSAPGFYGGSSSIHDVRSAMEYL